MTDHDLANDGKISGGSRVDEISNWAEVVFQTLFELEKKYSRSLKVKKIVGVQESEDDRVRISDAYLYLKNLKENLIDSALYSDFIDMSELREKSYLEQLLYPEKRLEKFAFLVSKLSQAVFTVEGETSIPITDIGTFLENDEIHLESESELESFISKNKEYVIPLKNIIFSKSDYMSIERDVYDKFVGKTFNREALNVMLSSIEAELLSRMISEKKIQVIHEGDKLLFEELTDEDQIEGVSSSVLLSPAKK
ncbi:MAG: hypothetical protein H7641_06975 [Candidatus Heimdallarchaeota archaeon]|nr:hypothetical protein [Candidatus Heimdallarchaeota archaeon]MCK4877307.1 hypothetical protein [Candidatus Heimdallarchaeota archaeon]